MKTRNVMVILSFLSSVSVWHAASAQAPAVIAGVDSVAAHRYQDGRALERRGDSVGAHVAFLEAANGGYPPAQRRLGEIYDQGNPAVTRDYSASIHWYSRARDAGERIPAPASRLPEFSRSR